MRFIKKFLLGVLIFFLLFILWAFLTLSYRSHRKAALRAADTVTLRGTDYAYLATEGTLYYLGELEFETGIDGEPESFGHLLGTIQTGLYSIKGAGTDNILIRYRPDNEWAAIYRKSDLPPLDYSADNCCRLEFVKSGFDLIADAVHVSCGDGISDPSVIADFLSDVRRQQTPDQAGLYNLIHSSDDGFKTICQRGVIYGFFREEPYVAVRMPVYSYSDQAYSISIEGKDYVLPEKWVGLLGVH